jgi:hypothetical protein
MRIFHNEDLHKCYSSPSIIRMLKTRKMSYAENEELMGKKRDEDMVLVGKARRK